MATIVGLCMVYIHDQLHYSLCVYKLYALEQDILENYK